MMNKPPKEVIAARLRMLSANMLYISDLMRPHAADNPAFDTHAGQLFGAAYTALEWANAIDAPDTETPNATTP